MTSPLARILVVDDNREMVGVVGMCLEHEGYRVIAASDGQQGLNLALEERPDLVVLDIEMPILDGIEVCRELRRLEFESPVLMLTGRALTGDKVAGLNAGADDYLAKPFELPEFLARVRALLRRRKREQQQVLVLDFGPVHVDLAQRTATRDGRPLPLTKTEYALLDLLAKNTGLLVSRETMLDVVWGYARFPSTRTVDTHIWRLRKKIGDDGEPPRWIKSIAGQGYCLLNPEDAAAQDSGNPSPDITHP